MPFKHQEPKLAVEGQQRVHVTNVITMFEVALGQCLVHARMVLFARCSNEEMRAPRIDHTPSVIVRVVECTSGGVERV